MKAKVYILMFVIFFLFGGCAGRLEEKQKIEGTITDLEYILISGNYFFFVTIGGKEYKVCRSEVYHSALPLRIGKKAMLVEMERLGNFGGYVGNYWRLQ